MEIYFRCADSYSHYYIPAHESHASLASRRHLFSEWPQNLLTTPLRLNCQLNTPPTTELTNESKRIELVAIATQYTITTKVAVSAHGWDHGCRPFFLERCTIFLGTPEPKLCQLPELPGEIFKKAASIPPRPDQLSVIDFRASQWDTGSY
jgi:hypothetical protein